MATTRPTGSVCVRDLRLRVFCAVAAAALAGAVACGQPTTERGRRAWERSQAERASELQAEGLVPDRRPVLMIRVWNGTYEAHDPRGLSTGLEGDDAGRMIVRSLERAYAQGWRRMMLLLPTGKPKEEKILGTLGEWWERTPSWRNAMSWELREFMADHPDVTLGLYTGLQLRGGAMPTQEQVERSLQPWIDLGVTEFALDATAPQQMHELYRSTQAWLQSHGARAIMEALPIDRSNGAVREELLASTPMMALEEFVNVVDPNGRWTFDPQATEVWVGLGVGAGRPKPFTVREIEQWIDRGFVPLVYSIDDATRSNALVGARRKGTLN